MKIALVSEWSQSEKNEVVYNALKKVAEKQGHTVDNYGQYNLQAHRTTYVQNAVLISALLESGAADFVVTGCGTGEGAAIAANSMPGVSCGLVIDPVDAYMFTQVNRGNCISMPFGKGFGWAADLNLQYVFERLLAGLGSDEGYIDETTSASIRVNVVALQDLKKVACCDIKDIIKNADREMVKNAFGGKNTMKLLEENCKDTSILDVIKEVVSA